MAMDAAEDADDALAVTARHARAQAAELRAQARERLAWARAVQAEAWDVREQVAAASRRAEAARMRAMGMHIAAFEAWTRAAEVRALSQAAGERARALRTHAS